MIKKINNVNIGDIIIITEFDNRKNTNSYSLYYILSNKESEISHNGKPLKLIELMALTSTVSYRENFMKDFYIYKIRTNDFIKNVKFKVL